MPRADLAALKAERDAINDQIALIEQGIKTAAYDAEYQRQLIDLNEARIAQGKRQLTKDEFWSGIVAGEGS